MSKPHIRLSYCKHSLEWRAVVFESRDGERLFSTSRRWSLEKTLEVVRVIGIDWRPTLWSVTK